MSENNTAALETTLAEDVETTEIDFVEAFVTVAFGDDDTITPYKIAVIVNKVFEANEHAKRIPPQMMYNYDRNGIIAKGIKGAKAYNKTQVTEFVTKFTNKHLAK